MKRYLANIVIVVLLFMALAGTVIAQDFQHLQVAVGRF